MTSREPLAMANCKEVYEHATLWAIKDVISELKLVDAGHLISYVFTDSHANIRDLLASSSELFLKADTLHYRGEAVAELDWASPPKILLEMEFRHQDLTARFALRLMGEISDISIESVRYADGTDGSQCDIERYVSVLKDALIREPSKEWITSGLLM